MTHAALLLPALLLIAPLHADTQSANRPIQTYPQFQEKVCEMADTLQEKADVIVAKKLINNKKDILPRSVYFDHATHYSVSYTKNKGNRNNKYHHIKVGFTYSDGARILAAYRHPEIKDTLTPKELKALETAQKLIADFTHPDMTRLEKVLFLHDALAHHGGYDFSNIGNQSCVSMLVNGKGACGAYARCMQLLLSMLEIPHHVIQGDNKAGGPHCWGLVQLDDENWYHVDVTKDDNPTKPYQYFCVTDACMAQEHIWAQNDYPATPREVRVNIPTFDNDEAFWDAAQYAYLSGAISFCARLTTPSQESAAQQTANSVPATGSIKIYRTITTPSQESKFIFLSFRE